MIYPLIATLAFIVFGIIVALICPLLTFIEEWMKYKNNKLKEDNKLKEEIKELKKQLSEAEVLVAEVVEKERPKALTESKVKYVKALMPQEEKEIDKLIDNQIEDINLWKRRSPLHRCKNKTNQ